MANSIITELGDGTTTQFALNFTLGILRREYVTCRVGNEVDGLGAPVYRTLEWITDGLVNVQGAAPGLNVPVVFKRTMPKNELIHDYLDGVPIIEANLDESNLQSIMSIHEFLDGRLEAGFVQDLPMNGYKITGLGTATNSGDAVNLGQLDAITADVLNAVADSQAAAGAAEDALLDITGIAIDVAQDAADSMQAAADAAALLAAAGLPAISGKALNFLRVNSGETSYEHRTASQVAGDISAVDTTSAQTITGVKTFSNAEQVNQNTTQQAQLKMFRNAATSNGDIICQFRMHALDSASNDQQFVNMEGIADVVTNAAEDGSLRVRTLQGGTLTQCFKAGKGIQVGVAPTGGDKGVGTINTSAGYYWNNVQMMRPFTSSAQSYTAGGLITVAHGFSSKPLQGLNATALNGTTEGNWEVGDEPVVPVGTAIGGTTYMHGLYADATNLYLRVSAGGVGLTNKTVGTGFVTTSAKWTIKLHAQGV